MVTRCPIVLGVVKLEIESSVAVLHLSLNDCVYVAVREPACVEKVHVDVLWVSVREVYGGGFGARTRSVQVLGCGETDLQWVCPTSRGRETRGAVWGGYVGRGGGACGAGTCRRVVL